MLDISICIVVIVCKISILQEIKISNYCNENINYIPTIIPALKITIITIIKIVLFMSEFLLILKNKDTFACSDY